MPSGDCMRLTHPALEQLQAQLPDYALELVGGEIVV